MSFDELLLQSDIVSLHCPRNAHTVGMMNAARFAAMKPGAIFITTARSGIHDEAALADALTSGHLAGAGLDVWDQEPPPPEHPLLALPNVVATYHTAGVTQEARRNNATLAATQIAQLLTTGQRPERLVNRDVWPRASGRLAALGLGPERHHRPAQASREKWQSFRAETLEGAAVRPARSNAASATCL